MRDPVDEVGSVTEEHPFGDSDRERFARIAGGVGVAALVAGALLARGFGPDFSFVPGAVGFLGGLPLAWLIERRWAGEPGARLLLRYALLGAGLATAAAFVVFPGLLLAGPVYFLIVLTVAVPLGLLSGGIVAWIGGRLPMRVAAAAAVAGLLGTATLALWAWYDAQPPAPYDFVLLHDTALVRLAFADVDELAGEVAQGFDLAEEAGADRLADDTWVSVLEWVTRRHTQPLPHDAAASSPVTSASTGALIRLVTVGLGEDRRCVVVRRASTEIRSGICEP